MLFGYRALLFAETARTSMSAACRTFGASLDPELRGLFASVGIQKGKPFAPDARMTKILTDAVAIGNATG